MRAASITLAQSDLDALALAGAQAEPTALCAWVDRWAHAALAHTLCTVNRFDPENMSLRRLYSSDPVAYPPGGGKDKRGTPWGRHVLLDKKIFIGEGEEAIRGFFNDHQAIAALGLRSVINVPIVARGQCLGTLNFLMPVEQVEPAKVLCARLAGQFVLPALLMLP